MGSAKTSLTLDREYFLNFKVENVFQILFNFRKKLLLFASMECDTGYYESYGYYATEQELTNQTTYIESANRYARTDWLSKQSFCYEDQKSVELFSTIATAGVTYGFNLNGEIYDRNS